MRKTVSLLVLAAVFGTATPLTRTQAAPVSLTFPRDRTYEQGFEFGESLMTSCSITTQAEWQDKRTMAKQRSDYYYATGNLNEGAYYRGYYDGLGETFQSYC